MLKMSQENQIIDLRDLNRYRIGDHVIVDASAENDCFDGIIIGIEMTRRFSTGPLEPSITLLHDGYITDGFKPIDCRKVDPPAPAPKVKLGALCHQPWRWTISSAIGRMHSSSSSVTPLWNRSKSWLATICPSRLSGRIFKSLQRASMARVNFSISPESRKSNMFSLPSKTTSFAEYRTVFSASQEREDAKIAPVPPRSQDVVATQAPAPNALAPVTAGQGVEVKPLEWQSGEARSSLGDLYSISGLSEHVWVTYWNGTAFPGWKSNGEAAKAVAQADYDERRGHSGLIGGDT